MLYVPDNTKEIRHTYILKHDWTRENQVILLMITNDVDDDDDDDDDDDEKWHYLVVKKISALFCQNNIKTWWRLFIHLIQTRNLKTMRMYVKIMIIAFNNDFKCLKEKKHIKT